MAGFGTQKSVKFVEVKPGSKILVEDYASPPAYEPFEAFVLNMKEEYGPQRIPMLLVSAEHNKEIMIMADGRTKVKILVDSDVLAPKKMTPNAKHLRAIPREVFALQFRGGVDSATEIIQFAAGKAAIRWIEQTDQTPECLEIQSIDGNQRIGLGDWAVQDAETGTVRSESGSTLDNKFEDFSA